MTFDIRVPPWRGGARPGGTDLLIEGEGAEREARSAKRGRVTPPTLGTTRGQARSAGGDLNGSARGGCSGWPPTGSPIDVRLVTGSLLRAVETEGRVTPPFSPPRPNAIVSDRV